MRGLALSLSIAYTRGGAARPRRLPPVVRPPGRARDLGAAGAASSSPPCPWPSWCSWCPTSRRRPASPGSLARVVGSVLAGGLTFGAVVIWLGRRHDTHRRPPLAARRPRRPDGPDGPSAAPRGPVRPSGPQRRRPDASRRHGRPGSIHRRPGASSEPLPRPAHGALPGPHRPSVADSLHARRPHRHRQCLRPDRPARQGAQRHRGAADHPLRRRGARGPAPAHPGRVLGALPRQGRPAPDGRPLPRRLPGRLPAGRRRGRRRRPLPDHLLQGVRDLRLGRDRGRHLHHGARPRRRHVLAHHGPGPAGHRRRRGGRGRGRPRRAGRRHRGPHPPHPHLRRAGRARAPAAGRPHRRAPGPCSARCSTSSR